MNFQTSSSQTNCSKTISSEQLNQVIEAIADGRYSWACVLLLRFVDYNPLHFIPQRTYSRLIKENNKVTNFPGSSHNRNSSQDLNKINNLDYLENSHHKQPNIQKNSKPRYFETKKTGLSSLQLNRVDN
ncbi:MAG: HetP family heterocyst commitment protein [Desmonostoc vinosum HA7617-LM4]|jgi:hypothetical protein|nr:HetP family heterocyst commitment protein [Desmonostoc vinosum HA7617-LM4]